jgi:hypothetical protein
MLEQRSFVDRALLTCATFPESTCKLCGGRNLSYASVLADLGTVVPALSQTGTFAPKEESRDDPR